MILHVVTFVWNPDVSEAEIQEISALLGALPARIPALLAYQFGADARIKPGNGDFALVATVADEAGLAAYLDHPEHKVAAGTLRAMAESRIAVQVRVGA